MSPVIEVAVGVLVRPTEAGDWHVLITRRPSESIMPGYWEMPGGKVHEGESIDVCLLRELKEELDVEAEIIEPLPPVEHVYDHGHVRLHGFFCRVTGGQVRNVAVSEHRWVLPTQFADYRFLPGNSELMRLIEQRLRTLEPVRS